VPGAPGAPRPTRSRTGPFPPTSRTIPMRSSAVLLSLAIALAACGGAGRSEADIQIDTLAGGAVRVRNPAAGLWAPGEAWRAVEAVRIGSVEGAERAYAFGEVADLTLDPLGRVWVLEGQAKELRVFDPAGRHLRSVGRAGGGPGELRNPIGLAWDGAGRLWVADPGNQRFEVFDTAGRHVRSYRRLAGGWGVPWGGGFGRAGNFLYEPGFSRDPRTGAGRQTFVRHRVDERELVPADTFALPGFPAEIFEIEYRNGHMMVMVPFSPVRTLCSSSPQARHS
jgi:hypothetical protein